MKLNEVKKPTIPVTDLNNRPFSSAEERAFKNAKIINTEFYKIIEPVPGTLCYSLRNIEGGNEAVISLIMIGISNVSGMAIKKFKHLVDLYNKLDLDSRQRPDLFDHLTDKYNIPKPKFYGWLHQGIFVQTTNDTKIKLQQAKLKVLDKIVDSAMKDENFPDRNLAAKMTGLIDDKPLINIDQSKHNTVNNQLFLEDTGFMRTIRGSDDRIRNPSAINTSDQKLLSEAQETLDVNFDIIDGELVENER